MKNFKRQILWVLVVLLISSVPSFAYYNPKTGRFLQRDPIGERDGICIVHFADSGSPRFKQTKIRNQCMNGAGLYEYVETQPVNYSDEYGLQIMTPYPYYNPTVIPDNGCCPPKYNFFNPFSIYDYAQALQEKHFPPMEGWGMHIMEVIGIVLRLVKQYAHILFTVGRLYFCMIGMLKMLLNLLTAKQI